MHACLPADGEDIAREHLKGTESTPQLQKETSQQAGAPTTAGGAYASRDDPASQASQPWQIVQVGKRWWVLGSGWGVVQAAWLHAVLNGPAPRLQRALVCVTALSTQHLRPSTAQASVWARRLHQC